MFQEKGEAEKNMQYCNENVEQFLRTRIFQEDIRTGELVNELSMAENYVVNVAEAKRAKERREGKSEQHYKRRSSMPFVWSVYKLSARLMEELPGKHVAMLFYLATFDGYRGYLTTGKKPILRKQLPKMLGVSETTAYRFWKALLKAGIAAEDTEGKLALSEAYFQIGSLVKREMAVLGEQDVYLSRAYVKSIRDLYETSQPGTRNYLGHLFQILPFVNREYNIVCHNPLETELEKIRPMSFGEVCEAIGYDTENAHRLLSELLKLKFTVNGKTQSAVRYVITNNLSDRRTYEVFINPHVLYAGSHQKEVEVLGSF